MQVLHNSSQSSSDSILPLQKHPKKTPQKTPTKKTHKNLSEGFLEYTSALVRKISKRIQLLSGDMRGKKKRT